MKAAAKRLIAAADFAKRIAKIRRLARQGAVDRALLDVDRMLAVWRDHPRLLVLKARLIQLSDSADGPSLDDARGALGRAAEMDAGYADAWTEWGFYLLNIQDDAKRAARKFDHAIEANTLALSEAIAGRMAAASDGAVELPARKRAELNKFLRVAEALVELQQRLRETVVGRNGRKSS
jgi:hypothetical protein